jgi:hypothetical protein
MALAGILAAAKDELICDLAETYGIFDMQALPVSRLAVLACGLRQNSRVFQKLMGYKAPLDMIIQAMMLDRLNVLTWLNTADAVKGKNRPEAIAPSLMGLDQSKDKDKAMVFATPEDFMAAWNSGDN